MGNCPHPRPLSRNGRGEMRRPQPLPTSRNGRGVTRRHPQAQPLSRSQCTGRMMKRRSGFTLIEMLVVITMGATIMATAVGLLYTFFEADRKGREHVACGETLVRLETDFRGDAHAAATVDLPSPLARVGRGAGGEGVLPAGQNSAAEFTFAGSNRKVRYREAPDGLVREERQADAVTKREAYRLPSPMRIVFNLENGSPSIVSIQIGSGVRRGEPVDGPPVRIDAAMGSDHRFSKSGGPAK